VRAVRKFKRRGDLVTTHLSEYEVHLLSSLVNQLVEMVTDGESAEFAPAEPNADPFEEWARDLQTDPDAPETSEDPVLRRLFPDAYPHDAAASSDFRRFTGHDLKAKKVHDARTVLAGLEATEEGLHPVRIRTGEVDDWLRTLTSVRLAVGTRLGITDAEAAEQLARLADDDPRAFMVSVYDWLGFAQETLISAL
jgi:hypothetical protein